MALTITWEGVGVIANASSTTESIGLGTNQWNEDGAGRDSWTTDTYLQGGECFAGAYSNNSGFQYYRTSTSYDFTTNGNADGQFIYVWVNCPTIGLMATKALKGVAIRIGTDLNNYNDYTVAGSDDANGWLGDWKCFVIDPNKTATVTGGSGVTLSNINYIGMWTDATATAKGDNNFIDQIAIGTGLRVTGTSTTGWQDIKDYVSAYATRAWGVYDAREKFLGKIHIGDENQTAITQFSDTGQTIQFGTCEYWNGTAWVSTVPTHASGIILDDATGFRTEFTDGLLVGTDNGRSGSTFIGNDNELTIFDASSLTHASSFVKLYNTQFRKFTGGVKLFNNSSSVVYGVTITESGQFDPVGAPIVRNCIFSATTDNDGTAHGAALLWNTNANIRNCQFIANVNSGEPTYLAHGIEHPDDGNITYYGLFFTGNDQHMLNTDTGVLAITVDGTTGGNASASEATNTGGGSTTVSNPITLKLDGVLAGSEIHILKSGTTTTADSTDSTAYISSSVGTEHSYNYNYPPSGYTAIDIHIIKPGYEVIWLEAQTVQASNQSIPIEQDVDRNYVT